MNSTFAIYTEKAECQDCYKCVRECSVKAIRVEGGRAAVVPELCVACGHCVAVCPVGAKKVRDDLSRAKALIASGRKVVASLAPSFASEYEGIAPAKLIAAIKALGVSAVSETARGADIVARRVALGLQAQGGPLPARGTAAPAIFLSSACPAVVEYLGKYLPGLASRVTKLLSPLQAHAQELKEEFGGDSAVLFIGPCVAKKREADLRRDLIDVAIDFKDLEAWMADEGIRPDGIEAGPEDAFALGRAGAGALYPYEGGMAEAIASYPIPAAASLVSYSGLGRIALAMADLERAKPEGPLFIELLACEGGCVNGPRACRKGGCVVKRLAVGAYARSAPTAAIGRDSSIGTTWGVEPISAPAPSAEELGRELRRVGKYVGDDELNCGGCGYDTCREFARAMAIGKAEPGMCVSYMRKLAQKKANGLINAIPSAVAIVDSRLRIVECNRAFARLAGTDADTLWEAKPGLEGVDLSAIFPAEALFAGALSGAPTVERELRHSGKVLHATVFCIEDGGLAGGVFQDITAPWVRKDRVVSKARKVIDKNLAVVQKIAYLLGENAAETEAILGSIIESFDGNSEDAGS